MAKVITVCFSTLLPSIAVLGLYYIDQLTARLGAIIAFSATFSLVLALFTNAKPIEIFTATASYDTLPRIHIAQTNAHDQLRRCASCIRRG